MQPGGPADPPFEFPAPPWNPVGALYHPRCIKKESSLGRSSTNNRLGQRMCDSLCWLAATMDFLSSDIAVTLLAKVLEVNDSGQCQHPFRSADPLLIQTQDQERQVLIPPDLFFLAE